MERPAGAGALGPRLIGRLTAELILRSPQYMSCVKLYELDLRGNKIGAIENLGATENQFDSIDLTDNAIVKLEGFPKLPRLEQLLLNNNRVSRIGKNLHDSIPNLRTLVLTNNRLSNLQDLDPLSSLEQLTLLSLVGNPVVTKPNYRLYLISRLKHLKILDFKKVKQKEREAAAKLFPADGSAAAAHASNTFDPAADLQDATAALTVGSQPTNPATAMDADGNEQEVEEDEQSAAGGDAAASATAAGGGGATAAPTAEQLIAVKAAIANAQTLEEITRLEAALKSGSVPSQVLIGMGATPAANGHGNGKGVGGGQPDAMDVG